MQHYVIGVDIGTGSTKAVAVNYSGEVLAASQFYYSNLDSLPGYAEQDAQIIWQAFVNTVKKIITTLKITPSAISLSSCMHSLIAVNSNNKPLTNLITWADTRSEEIADEIRHSAEAENIYKATGTPIHSMSPLSKIIWFKRNEPGIFNKAFKFISIKEFIWHKLFDDYQVDYSVASATGLFNIQNFEWNKDSLLLCGITPDHLSKIVSTQYVRNNITATSATLLGIAADTSICIGASDGCLANIGTNAFAKGIAAITIGTSGAVRIASASPVFNYQAMTFNYVLDENTFICGGPVNNGGNVIKWLFKNCLNNAAPSADDYKKLFQSAASVKEGSNGLLFLPYLHGERAPLWDEKACGVLIGIKDHHTNAHMLKALLEGICYSLNNILQIIEAISSPVVQLNVSGGFIDSEIWMQILANITGKKVCIIQTNDASAIGAAMFCLKAMKFIPDYSCFQKNADKVIKPHFDSYEAYKMYYNVFKNLYTPLKETMHQLYTINH